LREFKHRWYLLAKDVDDGSIKVFGLDRISNLEISTKRFSIPQDFDVNNYYQYCYGIMSPNGDAPEEVVLSFDPFQGKYIKSLPLHPSQEIIKDDEDELMVKLKLFVTHDFLMELLSFGENVKVISPETLIITMKTAYQNALHQY
jgi:predicted DNA-binding transcriptional regulator YafY